jgi:hypothetical protein
VIIGLNKLIVFLYSKLSSLEKHKYKVHEMISKTIKFFLLQFLNLGVILIIINTDFGN